MTDNEKLIEEAAKAISEANDEYGEYVGSGSATWEMFIARAALAVFEKSHTPTGDEHEIVPTSPTGRIDSPVTCSSCGRSLFIGDEGGWQHVPRSEPQGEPSDADLTKLANDAHHSMVAEAEAEGGWYGFSHSRDAWQDGFETGYRARAARGER